MRTLLLLLLLAGVLSFAAVYVPIVLRRIRRAREETVPALSFEARQAAVHEPRIREAIDIRERIAEYARRRDIGLDRVLVLEVDELVRTMIELARMHHDLASNLDAMSVERLERDKALLDPGTVEGQHHQVAELRRRAAALESELARAVAGLRETWLGLLDALAMPGAGSLAASRTREQVETLRIRISAEKEARRDVSHFN